MRKLVCFLDLLRDSTFMSPRSSFQDHPLQLTLSKIVLTKNIWRLRGGWKVRLPEDHVQHIKLSLSRYSNTVFSDGRQRLRSDWA
eukprot:g28309.t1